MLKNMFKRSWLSVVRKPSRTVIIALILFVMANLVLASIAIKGSVNSSVEYAKSSLGGTVYLQADISKLRSQFSQQAAGDTSGTRPTFTRPEASLDTVKGIASSNYVKDYTYSVEARAKAGNFTAATEDTSGFGGRMGMGSDTSDTAVTPDIQIEGVNSWAFVDGVSSGTMTISSGKYFDETTDNSAMISYDLASADNLKVGDTITIENVYTETTESVTIIGIYDTTQTGFGTSANTIYMNTATAAKFLSTDDYNSGNYNVQNVEFLMTNSEYAKQFIAWANAKYPNLASENLSLTIDDAAYQQEVGPIESVGKFATTILWVVVIASIVIVSLIVTLNVKERRYEMGVLLSLGAKKANVIGQVLVELIVVGTVAFAISVGTGTAVAKVMGQKLLDQQVSQSTSSTANSFGRPTGGSIGGGMPNLSSGESAPTGGAGRFGGGASANTKAIKTIDVSATVADYLILFGVSYGVIVLALVVPGWNIVKYQPKEILSGKE